MISKIFPHGTGSFCCKLKPLRRMMMSAFCHCAEKSPVIKYVATQLFSAWKPQGDKAAELRNFLIKWDY